MIKKTLISICLVNMISWSIPCWAQKGQSGLYALDSKSLKENKSRLQANDPILLAAYKQLMKDAEKALQFGPVSVMEKTHIPPSGDKHDYMSLAPYHWPNPDKPDGLPYIRKDGQTNPEVKEYKDKEYMPTLCGEVHTLALAWYFSGEKRYAEHAAQLIRVWFLDTATRMNPNLNFAQSIKGVNTGRGAGLIDTRHFVKLIDGIGLIRDAKSWTEQDHRGMQKWFAQFLHWMQTSPNGLHEMKTKNNHGAWYDAQRISMALFIDSIQVAKSIVLHAADRLDKQMDDNGSFPEEMERTISLHYTTFVMSAFFTIAQQAEQTGFDFWNHVTPSGKSLKKAFDFLKPYLLKEKKWEGPQIKDFHWEDGYPILKEGINHFKCRNCEQGIRTIAGDKYQRLLVHLLY